MKRKLKLIQSLELAIDGLINNTIHYDWSSQKSCNCGVVVQALLGVSPVTLSKIMIEQDLFAKKNHDNFFGKDKSAKTWRESAQIFCPITGMPLRDIFTQLKEAGLSKEDIAHLEFMSNPAILKRTDIDVSKGGLTTKVERVKVGTKKTTTGVFIKKTIEEDIYENRETKIKNNFYQDKRNLIKYLTAWVSILKEERPELSENTSVDILRQIEIHAAAEEDYPTAILMRNMINSEV